MVILPDGIHQQRLQLLQWVLPKGLMPWLFEERGLRLIVLPQDTKEARKLLHDGFGVKTRVIDGDGRLIARTSHYCPAMKTMVLTSDSFWSYRGENVFLHELGHAIDYLYSGTGYPLSASNPYYEVLRPEQPLNDYCARKQKQNNNLLEQFACSFSAFFQEPEDEDGVNTIDDLSDELVQLFQKDIVKRFE